MRSRKEKGDPTKNPYPFEFLYDEAKSFSDKYDVVALENPEGGVPESILNLISGDPPDLSELVAPSNCLAFRAQVEAHLCEGVDFPLDDIFAPAKARGLMTPPASPPKDASRGRAPEVGRSEPTSPKPPPAQPRTAASAKAPPAKAPDPPAASDDGYQCDHCDADMEKGALVCGCGATYDEETGAMNGRPCLNEACKGKDADGTPAAVAIVGEGPRFICASCGTVHEQVEDPNPERKAEGLMGWAVVETPKAAEPVAGGRRRRGGAAVEPPPVEPPPAAGRARRGAGATAAPKA
jgi:hypothetical protein